MGRRAARPRPAATGEGEPGRQDLDGAHRGRGDRFGTAAGLRHRHSTTRPRNPATGARSRQPTRCTEAPGPTPASCQAPPNFAVFANRICYLQIRGVEVGSDIHTDLATRSQECSPLTTYAAMPSEPRTRRYLPIRR
jgi:hypothetical protein